MPKAVRHCSGIIQTGPKKGNLRHGFKYVHNPKVDKKVKQGYARPVVKKAKKSKK